MSPRLAFNTAASFVTGTNWQAYSGEVAMSHAGQLVGLVVAQFTAPAVSICVALALIRALAGPRPFLGNFWSDLARVLVRVLVPLAIIGAVVLAARGVIQNMEGFRIVGTLGGAEQVIPGGPAAAMESIKLLGNNGGGLFGTGYAHPFENPDGLTNAFQLYWALLLPFGIVSAYGRMVGNRRHARTVLAVLVLVWVVPTVAGMAAESKPNPEVADAAGGVSDEVGNLEGKDMRNGTAQSAMTTSGSMGTTTGIAGSAIDSYQPVGVGSALGPMLLGEVGPGGVGSGLVGAINYTVIAVLVGGLMVGRTPELLGHNLRAREMTLTTLYVVSMPALVLAGTGASVLLGTATTAALHDGTPRGFTEIFYAYASATNGNGSAMAGLGADTPWYDTILGLAMLGGRYLPIVASVALAGALARGRVRPATSGTLPTSGVTFGIGLLGVIALVGGLTFLPALVLGPLAEAR
jgi:potassium-transporting ATPase potassium-binding subunit